MGQWPLKSNFTHVLFQYSINIITIDDIIFSFAEKRRLRELEAMKKVEEEFQRKREREKADIRHQLRLYNLTEGDREQPDGAVIPPPAATTQVLSEFRQPRRDYRDYTPIR